MGPNESKKGSRLLYGATGHEDGAVAFAKKRDKTPAMFRGEIERLHSRDMLSLHEVRRLLKTQKAIGGHGNVQLGSSQIET